MPPNTPLLLEDPRWSGPWPTMEQWVRSLYPPFGTTQANMVLPSRVVITSGTRAGTHATNHAVICTGLEERDVLTRLAGAIRQYLSTLPGERGTVYLGLVAYRMKADENGDEREIEWTEKERVTQQFVRRETQAAVTDLLDPDDLENAILPDEEEEEEYEEDEGDEEEPEEDEEEEEAEEDPEDYQPPEQPRMLRSPGRPPRSTVPAVPSRGGALKPRERVRLEARRRTGSGRSDRGMVGGLLSIIKERDERDATRENRLFGLFEQMMGMTMGTRDNETQVAIARAKQDADVQAKLLQTHSAKSHAEQEASALRARLDEVLKDVRRMSESHTTTQAEKDKLNRKVADLERDLALAKVRSKSKNDPLREDASELLSSVVARVQDEVMGGGARREREEPDDEQEEAPQGRVHFINKKRKRDDDEDAAPTRRGGGDDDGGGGGGMGGMFADLSLGDIGDMLKSDPDGVRSMLKLAPKSIRRKALQAIFGDDDRMMQKLADDFRALTGED